MSSRHVIKLCHQVMSPNHVINVPDSVTMTEFYIHFTSPAQISTHNPVCTCTCMCPVCIQYTIIHVCAYHVHVCVDVYDVMHVFCY